MQDLSTFMQDKLGYTTGPWENYDAQRVSKSFLLKIGTSITLINFLSDMFTRFFLDELPRNLPEAAYENAQH
jgi:hypothetical protein